MTASQARIVIGLPAYNEGPNIDPLFEKIAAVRKSHLPRLSVLIYNDGSKDDTAARARAWNGRDGMSVRVIGLEQNRGLGVAMWSLIEDFTSDAWGGQPGADYLGVMDCDDTMDPMQLLRMWKVAEINGRDLVIASRYRPAATINGVVFHRRVMSQGAGLLFKLMHPITGVRDYSCGYRLYNRKLLKSAVQSWGRNLIAEKGFASMVEVLLKLGNMPAAQVGEIPLQLNYQQKRGASKMQVGDNATRLLKLAWRWRQEGLIPPAKTAT
jgi:dolichol-phosphate mannosyltransferase